MKVGYKYDTGKKWIDGSIIYKKLLSIGALPNNTTKNVPHTETISLTKYARVSALSITNGTTTYTGAATATINNTNVIIATTTDLSLYTGYVEIEFCAG